MSIHTMREKLYNHIRARERRFDMEELYDKDKAKNVNYAIQHMIDFLGGDK